MSATASRAANALVRQELRRYATSPIFLIGAALLLVQVLLSTFAEEDDGASSTITVIAPATLLGLMGIIAMANLTRRSDRSAQAAGTTAIGEFVRTRALIAAVAVPVTAALVWYAWAVAFFRASPPADWAVPSGPVSTGYVLSVMFALSVLAAAGGPLLGLVIARWVRFRGATALFTVAMVIVTILMQGNFTVTWRWHVIWPWTYWYGPLGWHDGSAAEHIIALPGNPYAWIGYLLGLCAIGALAALYHDPEAPRGRLRVVMVVVGLAVIALLAVTMLTGLAEPYRNPLPSPIR